MAYGAFEVKKCEKEKAFLLWLLWWWRIDIFFVTNNYYLICVLNLCANKGVSRFGLKNMYRISTFTIYSFTFNYT